MAASFSKVTTQLTRRANWSKAVYLCVCLFVFVCVLTRAAQILTAACRDL